MLRSTTFKAALLLSVVAVAPARADVSLLAIGTLDGTSGPVGPDRTRSKTACPTTFWAAWARASPTPAATRFWRFPTAVRTPSRLTRTIDNTASYINRFQTLKLNLTPNPGGALPFTLTPTLTKTTLLYSSTPLTYGTGAGLGVGPGRAGPEHAGQILFHRPVRQFRARRVLGDHERALRSRVGSRLQRRKDRLHLRRIRPLCARSSIARPDKLIKTFTLPGNLSVAISVSARRCRNERQHERPHRQQGHGRPRAHARRQDAGRHHAGAAHPGCRQDRPGQQNRSHRHDRHRERRHQGIRLQPDFRLRRERHRGAQRSSVPGRRARRAWPRRRQRRGREAALHHRHQRGDGCDGPLRRGPQGRRHPEERAVPRHRRGARSGRHSAV